ncbi:MAG: CsbD family protein [Alphaproteobacteria bacterium]|nr:CsbD family protein [Alphaproteobacteria bacterium]MBV9015944.1 CsbD family protein [Alphaproteobacteria bacterium]MBV9154343.1 CsbD family protein [Alphaproteobacteria bacterium]
MDRQRIEGGLKKATGTIKEQAGKAIGDRHLETEGNVEKTEGRIRSGVGKAMDAVRDVVNEEK